MSGSFSAFTGVLFAIFVGAIICNIYIQHRFYAQLVQKHLRYFKSIGSPLLWGGSLDGMVRSAVLSYKMLFKRLPRSVTKDPVIEQLTNQARGVILVALIILVALFITSH